jgi:hypothetical protein
MNIEKQINEVFQTIAEARKRLRHAELEMQDSHYERWAQQSWAREVTKEQQIIEDADLEIERLRLVIEARKLEQAE